ncbi:MAG: heparan-alpha-glucosaminide N-acetyltransferase [Methanomicrobiales archaeon]|nr:heparan-alpha-glucosaminide N-acetyltransferase [Methanomicrobiales archaeon]
MNRETDEVPNPREIRYWEVDALRGLAVFMMILYHILFDIDYLDIARIQVGTGPLRLLALATVTIFLLLVGVSLTMSYHRHSRVEGITGYGRFFRRGLRILVLAGTVTLVTYLVIPERFIVFGVLHCIGLSVIIGPLFIRLGAWNFFTGCICILMGSLLSTFSGPAWLLWAGIVPDGFASLDYVPMFPWFGVVMVGIAAGTLLYPEGIRAFSIRKPSSWLYSPLLWSGRHSLLVYMIHQPLILGALGILYPVGIQHLFSGTLLTGIIALRCFVQ